MARAKRNGELAESILKLAEQLISGYPSPAMIERQFFFRFWCQPYLRKISHLKQVLPITNKSLEQVCQEALYGQGLVWLKGQNPQAVRILGRLEKKYGIAWQEVLIHILTGNLPSEGYPKAEYYPPTDKSQTITVPPGSFTIVIHRPSAKDIDDVAGSIKTLKLLRRSARQPSSELYVRRCACLCLAERAGYGNREAIREWNRRFHQFGYGMADGAEETQPGEIQFSRDKRDMLKRFKQLEAGRIGFLTNLP